MTTVIPSVGPRIQPLIRIRCCGKAESREDLPHALERISYPEGVHVNCNLFSLAANNYPSFPTWGKWGERQKSVQIWNGF